MDVVLALGFDLFLKPKLNAAADALGVQLRYVPPARALEDASVADVTRVVADVSAPGALDAALALRAARPDLPLVACYPPVQEDLARAVREAGGVAITRGAFVSGLPDTLAGKGA